MSDNARAAFPFESILIWLGSCIFQPRSLALGPRHFFHSCAGIEFAVQRNARVLIGDEMGLGKTVQAIAVAALYVREWPLLICCPASLRWQWAESIEKWLPFMSQDRIKVVMGGKYACSQRPCCTSHATYALSLLALEMALRLRVNAIGSFRQSFGICPGGQCRWIIRRFPQQKGRQEDGHCICNSNCMSYTPTPFSTTQSLAGP